MSNHLIPATGVEVARDVRVITVESWDVDDYQEGIVRDRTHADEGEWGDQLIDWSGDLDDVLTRLRDAGFTLSEPVDREIDGEVGTFIAGERA